jgi:AcrR family transcriptional regulator
MSSEQRRQAIVQAVLPVFARNGFARTTTRELARAAGVSEALLYKHFPSKESLYLEIQAHSCGGCDPVLRKLATLEPSTLTLVYIVYYIVRRNLLGADGEPAGKDCNHRLLLHSCLEDGYFSRLLFRNRLSEHLESIQRSLEAAEAAGDLVASAVDGRNRVLFVHHVAAMVAAMHLPPEPVIDYQADGGALLHEVMGFALRGLGLTEPAIRRYYQPKAMALFFANGPG